MIIDRSVVTVVILAYNQEEFIEDAVKSAIEQTYDNLQIIIVDDFSNDKTYLRAKNYSHFYGHNREILIIKNERNLGTLVSLFEASKISKGDLIVVFHGDDISKVDRVEKIFAEWKRSGAWGIYSNFDRINSKGKLTTINENPVNLFSSEYRFGKYFLGNEENFEVVYGPVSAYDKRIFDKLELNHDDYILSEDGVMSMILQIYRKKISKLSSSLVYYRSSEKSVTNSEKIRNINFDTIIQDEFKIERFARSHFKRCELLLRINLTHSLNDVNVDEIVLDLNLNYIRMNWRSFPFFFKLKYIINNLNAATIRWALPRLFSIKAFFFVKYLIVKFKQLFFRRMG